MSKPIFPLLACIATAASVAGASEHDRGYAGELLADASLHASLLSDSATPGHDGRFFLASADGANRLNIGGEFQFRYLGNFGADSPASSADYTGGFQLNRTRLEFRGNVIDPKLTYRVLVNFNASGTLVLQDAYSEYELDNGLKIRWGQFKLPFDREFYATAPTQTQTIERSLVNSIFRLDRSQGIQLAYEADRWRLTGAISDGSRASDTPFTSAAEADIALTGRAELRLGDAGWRQFRDQTSFRDDKTGALLGLGGHWQQEGITGAPSGSTGTQDLFAYTADASYEGGGWNLLAAVNGRVIEYSGASIHDLGFIVQGGVFVTDHAEVFARYAHIIPDSDRPGGTDDFGAITAGLHWYFVPRSHAAKLTAEVTYYPSAQADSGSLVTSPNTGVGLLADTDDGQIGLGLQMQVLF